MKFGFVLKLVSLLKPDVSRERTRVVTAPTSSRKAQDYVKRKEELLDRSEQLLSTLKSVTGREVSTESERDEKEGKMCELTRLILAKTSNLLSFFGSADSVRRAEYALDLFKAAQAACSDWPNGDKRRKYRDNISERIEDLSHLLYDWYPNVREELERSRTLLTHSALL